VKYDHLVFGLPVYGGDIPLPGSDGLAFLNKNSAVVQKIKMRDFSNIPEANLLVKNLMTVQAVLELGEETDQYQEELKISIMEKTVGLILIKISPLFENRLGK